MEISFERLRYFRDKCCAELAEGKDCSIALEALIREAWSDGEEFAAEKSKKRIAELEGFVKEPEQRVQLSREVAQAASIERFDLLVRVRELEAELAKLKAK